MHKWQFHAGKQDFTFNGLNFLVQVSSYKFGGDQILKLSTFLEQVMYVWP